MESVSLLPFTGRQKRIQYNATQISFYLILCFVILYLFGASKKEVKRAIILHSFPVICLLVMGHQRIGKEVIPRTDFG